MTAYAFQCMDCGHLVEGAAAGERKVPINCPWCDIGSHLEWFSPDGFPATQGQVFTVTIDVPAVAFESTRQPGLVAWRDPEGFPANEDDVFPVTTEVLAIPRQVIDRANEFLVLADLTPKQQASLLQDRPNDTIERYVASVNGGPK